MRPISQAPWRWKFATAIVMLVAVALTACSHIKRLGVSRASPTPIPQNPEAVVDVPRGSWDAWKGARVRFIRRRLLEEPLVEEVNFMLEVADVEFRLSDGDKFTGNFWVSKTEISLRPRDGSDGRPVEKRSIKSVLWTPSVAEQIFESLERSGLAGMSFPYPGPRCGTVYHIAWIRPAAGVAESSVTFCAEDAPPQASEALRWLNMAADGMLEFLKGQKGGGP